MKRAFALPLSILLASTTMAADQWPQFRGPSGQAVSQSSALPEEWAKDKNLAWTAAVPGVAWSQPVVWGDKIFVTTAVTEKQTKPKAGGGMGFGPGRGGPRPDGDDASGDAPRRGP